MTPRPDLNPTFTTPVRSRAHAAGVAATAPQSTCHSQPRPAGGLACMCTRTTWQVAGSAVADDRGGRARSPARAD